MPNKEYDLRGRKLCVAIPAYDYKLSMKAAASLIRLSQLCAVNGVEFGLQYICGASIISVARNSMIREVLDKDYTDIMMIDSDINFEAEDVMRLMALATDVDIVGGVPRTREENGRHMVVFENKDDHIVFHKELGLVKADRITTAFLMVRRHVFERLQELHPEWRYKSKSDGKEYFAYFDFKQEADCYIGEDYLFCDRVRDAGFDVWADATISLGHMGTTVFQSDLKKEIIETVNKQKVNRAA